MLDAFGVAAGFGFGHAQSEEESEHDLMPAPALGRQAFAARRQTDRPIRLGINKAFISEARSTRRWSCEL